MASVLSRIQIIMEANTANYNNELKKAKKNSDSAFGGIAKTAGKMALGVGAALVAVGVTTLKTAGNFESAMNGVRAVSGATGEDFTKLRNLAKQMGSETAYSATEAAQGMEELAKAGLNTEQVMATIPSALNLASAGAISLTESTGILADVMGGMSLAAEESGRVADVLAKAAASSAVDVTGLGQSMEYIGPVADVMGQSLETTAALIGALGNKAITGGQAGTVLRGVFLRMANDKGANKWLDEFGVSLTDSNGNVRDMIDVLKELDAATSDLSERDKLEVFEDIAGKQGITGLAGLLEQAGSGVLDDLKGKLDAAAGSAKAMADIRMEGLEGAFKGLASAWEGFQLELADSGLLDIASLAVTRFAEGIRDFSKKLPEINAKLQEFFSVVDIAAVMETVIDGLVTVWGNLVSTVKAVGDAIAPVIGFFREHNKLSEALAISIGLVGGAFIIYNAAVIVGTAATVAFGAVLAFVTAPLTLIVVAMVAVVAAGVYLYQNWDMIKAKATEIWGGISNYIGGVVTAIKGYFTNNFPAMTAIVSGTMQTIGAVFSAGFALVKNTVVTVMAVVKAIFTGDFKAIPKIIGDGLSNAYNIVKTMLGDILDVFINTGKRLFQVGKDFILGFVDGVKSMAGAALGAATDVVKGAWQATKDFLWSKSPSKKMALVGGDFGQGFANGITAKGKTASKAAQKLAADAVKATQDGIKAIERELRLFGNSSLLAALDDDIGQGKLQGNTGLLRSLRIELDTKQEIAEITNLMVNYGRSIHDASVLHKTELGAINYELDSIHGKYKNIRADLKDSLRDEAAALDATRLRASGVSTILSLNRELSMLDNDSLFSRWAYDLNEASSALSNMDEATKAGILEAVARLESAKAVSSITNEIEGSLASMRKELALLNDASPINDFIYDLNETEKYANATGESIHALGQAIEELQAAKDMKSTRSALSEMLIGVENESPLDKLRNDYQDRIAVIEEFENAHNMIVGSAVAERLAVEQSYQDAKRDLMLASAEEQFGSVTDIMRMAFGEQNILFKAAFHFQRGLAIAQALLNIPESYSKAFNAVVGIPIVGPALAPIAGGAAAAMQVAQKAMIERVKPPSMPVGQAHDGLDYVPREGTWMLDKGERIVKPDDNRKLSKFLDSNSGEGKNGVNINITNNAPVEVSTSVNSDGDIEMRIDRRLNERLPQAMAQQINSPATPVREALTNNFNLERRF